MQFTSVTNFDAGLAISILKANRLGYLIARSKVVFTIGGMVGLELFQLQFDECGRVS